jgi:hypothetical protein
MAHDVFLSYSRKDKDTMQRLRDGLRQAGIIVWTDENLKVGTPAWEAAIQEAIENANCLIVLLSPDSKKSKWVGREIAYAENFKITILPVLISEKEKESIPIRLVDYQYASLVGADFERFVKELADVIPHVPAPASIPPPTSPPEARPPEQRQPTPPPAVSPNLFSSAPPLRQSPFGERASNLRMETAGQSTYYQNFLQRYQFDSAEWEKRRKQQHAEAAAKLETIRQGLPDAPAIRPWHPVDQLRLAWWMIMDPDTAYIFQYKTLPDLRVRAGAWLLSQIAYLPLLILTAAAAVGWLPVEGDLLGLPRVILPVAVVIFWALTELFAALTEDSDYLLVLAGSGVGLILMAPLVGGVQFMAAALLAAVICLVGTLLMVDMEETKGVLVFCIGFSALGIAGQMLHVDMLKETLPLVNLELPASFLLLAALCIVGGLAAAAAMSRVFQYIPGEGGGSSFLYLPSLTDNGLTTWLMGLGLALLICVTLAVGCAVAVQTNDDITGWIADRLPDKITGISPDVAFTVVGVDVSFSLVDITHGLVAGWTAFLVALVAGGTLLLVALIPAFIGYQAFDVAVKKRQRSPFGPLIAALYVAACLILLIVPPLTA